MSDDQQPEDLRPIPDGGLKDSMPGWLKRPPAWRNMPTAEQRHERTLPEPDTSEIDPKSLVEVSDLPQWLQTIASRGDVPAPQPDETVGYALQQIQAVSSRSRDIERDTTEAESETPDIHSEPEEPVVDQEPIGIEEPKIQEQKVETLQPVVTPSPPAESRVLSMALIISIVVIVLALGIGAYSLL